MTNRRHKPARPPRLMDHLLVYYISLRESVLAQEEKEKDED
jgi:hypothetical protein